MKKLFVGLLVLVLYFGSVVFGGKVWAIDYQLPYPGILPDSPVYFLKVARDRVTLWLVRDGEKRAFYLLFLADKRLSAGERLVNKQSLRSSQAAGLGGKSMSVGAVTAVKAEEYFGQAVDEALVVKSKGKNPTDLFAKLTVAAEKHREVIDSLAVKLSGRDSEQMVKAHLLNENSSNRVKEVFFQMSGVGK